MSPVRARSPALAILYAETGVFCKRTATGVAESSENRRANKRGEFCHGTPRYSERRPLQAAHGMAREFQAISRYR
jgi:hypothetical protein